LAYELTEGFELEFSFLQEGIISISGNTVTALTVGSVDVTGTVKGTEIKDTIKIIVVEQEPQIIPVSSVTIAGGTAGVVGGTITLTATVLPANATNKTVTWSTSDQTVATVQNGVVTLLKEGSVTITATADGK